jgi:hypothetical protein
VTQFHSDINDLLQQNISSLLDHPQCEGIPFLHPSRFYSCPWRCNHFKAVRGLDIWKFCLTPCLQNLLFILVKNLAAFDYVVGILLPLKCKLAVENFKLLSQSKENPFVVRPITRGKGIASNQHGEWGAGVHKGRPGRECVVFSG